MEYRVYIKERNSIVKADGSPICLFFIVKEILIHFASISFITDRFLSSYAQAYVFNVVEASVCPSIFCTDLISTLFLRASEANVCLNE